MPPPSQSKTRLYLAAPERRRHPLEVAAEAICAGGWEALSMQGVAEAAGVSRQLVYQHFASLDALHAALLVHLFEFPYQATRVIATSAETPQQLLRHAFETFLEMPETQRRLLRALATEDRPGRAELGTLKKSLRRKITSLWTPFVARTTGVADAEARALAWMLIMAAWGLSDLMRDSEIESDRAVALFSQIADAAIRASRAEPNTENG